MLVGMELGTILLSLRAECILTAEDLLVSSASVTAFGVKVALQQDGIFDGYRPEYGKHDQGYPALLH